MKKLRFLGQTLIIQQLQNAQPYVYGHVKHLVI